MSLLLAVISPVFLLSSTPAERVLFSLQKQIYFTRGVLSSRRPWPRQLPHPCAKHSQLSLCICQPGSLHQAKATDQRGSVLHVHILQVSQEQLRLAEKVPISFPNHRLASPKTNIGRNSLQFCSLTTRLFVIFKSYVQAQTRLGTNTMQAPSTFTLPGHLLPNIRTWPGPDFFLKSPWAKILLFPEEKAKKGKYHEAKLTSVSNAENHLHHPGAVLHLEHQTLHYTAQTPFKKNAREK